MKKTELKDVYTVPKTEEEWDLIGIKPHIYAEKSAVAWHKDMPRNNGVFGPTNQHLLKSQGRTEIPVSKFVDLFEDKIVGWRLEEIGFKDLDGERLYEDYELRLGFWNIRMLTDLQTVIILNGEKTNIKTFTELETLIRFLR